MFWESVLKASRTVIFPNTRTLISTTYSTVIGKFAINFFFRSQPHTNPHTYNGTVRRAVVFTLSKELNLITIV